MSRCPPASALTVLRTILSPLNVSDDEIPRIQALLHEKLSDIMVPVTTGHGSIDLIIPGVHKANGLRILKSAGA